MKRICIALLSAAITSRNFGQVVINEVAVAASDRNLQWNASGAPQLGSGIPWHALNFNATPWAGGNLPAGWGTTVNTNLQSAMQNKTPSLYLRKTFTVTPTQAALATPLVLQVEADDGFVAYINGVEVARANCGPAKHFMYVSQVAYNAMTTSGLLEYPLLAANTLLVSGTNVLSIQAHNSNIGSNFRLNAGLRLITSTQTVTLTKALYDFSIERRAAHAHEFEWHGDECDDGLAARRWLARDGRESDERQYVGEFANRLGGGAGRGRGRFGGNAVCDHAIRDESRGGDSCAAGFDVWRVGLG